MKEGSTRWRNRKFQPSFLRDTDLTTCGPKYLGENCRSRLGSCSGLGRAKLRTATLKQRRASAPYLPPPLLKASTTQPLAPTKGGKGIVHRRTQHFGGLPECLVSVSLHLECPWNWHSLAPEACSAPDQAQSGEGAQLIASSLAGRTECVSGIPVFWRVAQGTGICLG